MQPMELLLGATYILKECSCKQIFCQGKYEEILFEIGGQEVWIFFLSNSTLYCTANGLNYILKKHLFLELHYVLKE